MSEHTKGKLHQGTDPRQIISDAGVIVCTVSGALSHRDVLGDARRLVACWNAFDGISTEDIEVASNVEKQS